MTILDRTKTRETQKEGKQMKQKEKYMKTRTRKTYPDWEDNKMVLGLTLPCAVASPCVLCP